MDWVDSLDWPHGYSTSLLLAVPWALLLSICFLICSVRMIFTAYLWLINKIH
jgi:hypothetical protein